MSRYRLTIQDNETNQTQIYDVESIMGLIILPSENGEYWSVLLRKINVDLLSEAVAFLIERFKAAFGEDFEEQFNYYLKHGTSDYISLGYTDVNTGIHTTDEYIDRG